MFTKRLLIITTGGTIAGNIAGADPRASALVGHKLGTVLQPLLDHIKQDLGVQVELDIREVADVDSSDIQPFHWERIIEAIYESYDSHDCYIVTHGTNTMGYTSAALSFALENVGKPVIVTGSQVPFGRPGSDALMNLENALRVAAWEEGGGVRGVICVFGSHIITGTRAKKSTEFDYDAFQSFSTASLGRIGRIILWNYVNLEQHHRYLSASRPEALRADLLSVKKAFDPRLLSFTEFPGMQPDMFESLLMNLLQRDSLRGVVFRAFGAGDVSTVLHPSFEFLQAAKIPIVVTTQAPNGNSNFQVNEPGQKLAARNLAIPAHDMNIESITTKLMWLLGQQFTYSEVGRMMITDLHGEISVKRDRRSEML